MRRSDFRFLEPLRVRWSEVDLQKIVFNGHYLMYFDTAVAGYWRALALPYHDAMALLQGDLFVRKATLEYQGSARYDEQLQVGIRCARIGNSSMNFGAAVFRGQQLLVHGELVYVFADPQTQTSKPVPAPLRDLLQGFEAGEGMVAMETSAGCVHHAELGAVHRDMLADALDAKATQLIARNRLGQLVGAARLLPTDPGVADVDWMATLPSLRGAGLGRALLEELARLAQARGDAALRVHATEDSAPFFERCGFVRTGQPQTKNDITSTEMRRLL
jgi:YbgC/YbaW family acyl-CoA thioester hydrolase